MSRLGFVAVMVVGLAGALAVSTPRAACAQGKASVAQRREADRKAQIAFVAGRYQEAIDIFAQLYADFGEPEYLRNIGRCYQRMREPDKAISSFEEYLQKAKNITPAERDEVKGFIKEMEDLKKRRSSEGAPPPAPTPAPPPAPAPAPPSPAAAPPPSSAPGPGPSASPGGLAMTSPPPPGPSPDVTATSPPPAAPPSTGTGRTIGIVLMAAGGAALVAGGIVTALSWSKYNSTLEQHNDCRTYTPACRAAADSVESRNLLAKILFGAGGVLAASGAVVFLLSPSPSASAAAPGAVAHSAIRF